MLLGNGDPHHPHLRPAPPSAARDHPSGDAHASRRRRPGVHSFSAKARSWARNSSWCSSKAKCTASPRALSPGAARARARPPRCAGSRWCRRRSGPARAKRKPSSHGGGRPSSPSISASRAEQVEGGAVDGEVGLGPEQLVHRRLGARRRRRRAPAWRSSTCAAGRPRRRSRRAPRRRRCAPRAPGRRRPAGGRARRGAPAASV